VFDVLSNGEMPPEDAKVQLTDAEKAVNKANRIKGVKCFMIELFRRIKWRRQEFIVPT